MINSNVSWFKYPVDVSVTGSAIAVIEVLAFVARLPLKKNKKPLPAGKLNVPGSPSIVKDEPVFILLTPRKFPAVKLALLGFKFSR
ncbi:hypothetical protein HK413_05830 [Mucilaginibacter sp. S1162]|uniref:Uncharacterized protein n=1 Tax=Mucilaginibacter humi TaxID=2732510 RepID=A0ABX1W633_9SPHI|nr:hypothetical protein [Mucilaginibacter humi]NNU33780.1 hypothetical protein [Mucilaginibacter humi]